MEELFDDLMLLLLSFRNRIIFAFSTRRKISSEKAENLFCENCCSEKVNIEKGDCLFFGAFQTNTFWRQQTCLNCGNYENGDFTYRGVRLHYDKSLGLYAPVRTCERRN